MDFKAAQEFWTRRDARSVRMPPDMLRESIVAFITSHNTMALATGYGTFVRNTPLEYEWYRDSFWIMTEGGMKFLALEHNRNVCAAVFDPLQNGCRGLQVMCRAEITDPESADYQDFLKRRNINPETLARMPSPMPLLRLIPLSADYLNTALTKEGYSVRQHLEFPNP